MLQQQALVGLAVFHGRLGGAGVSAVLDLTVSLGKGKGNSNPVPVTGSCAKFFQREACLCQ
jgi:hypothetical protein